MITDEDIKKLATVFATKEDIINLKQELQKEIQDNTDSIVKEFVEAEYRSEKRFEAYEAELRGHRIELASIENRFQRMRQSLD